MFAKASSIHIDAPPEAVFDYVADIKRHPEWAHEKLEIEPVEGDSSRFKSVVHFMGTVQPEIRIVESERPRRFVYESADKASAYRWTFGVAPEGSGTNLTHSFERLKEQAWFVAIQGPMFRLVGRKMVTGGLANIKAKVEAAARA